MLTETKKRKICLAALNGSILVVSVIFAGFWLASTAQANKYNTNAQKYYGDTLNWYDTECWKGPFTDDQEALKFMEDISGCNGNECSGDGTKWSVMYALNGATFLLFSLNAILGIFGSIFFWPRVIGFVCNCCLSCILFAGIITTGVFRYRTWGKLCSLCTSATHITESGELTDKTTYESDGTRISVLFVFQILLFIFFCAGGMYPVKPARKEETPISNQLMHHN